MFRFKKSTLFTYLFRLLETFLSAYSKLLATFNVKKCVEILCPNQFVCLKGGRRGIVIVRKLFGCVTPGIIVTLPNPGVQKPEDSSPKHRIGLNITRLISICFSFDLPYGFWDLIFKWRLRFLPNHRILEAMGFRTELYWKLHLHPLLLKIFCTESRG